MRRALFATLLCAASLGAAGEDLGRLFSAPAERAAIDAAREARRAPAAPLDAAEFEAVDHASPATAPEVEPTPEAVTVNGYVARSAGPATVWVNGSDAASGRLTPPRDDGRRVQVPLGGGQVTLKPGQSFDPGTRRVSDAYEQRSHAPE